ncbi:uncharacterized protein LOC113072803 isoform X1 [Carassius auratus]|uniref:Uncharacterized protein LOC113072803 isoform X1 n=1 Tax=Carassius auratus TaxID=7957 RepID=A0A6P6MYY7_CARAU|nr:uncharacterized protein LOC113072803 isoform X1 [Carassius auratus]
MFYIVEFIETQEVEVVPALWVKDEICQWPAQYRPDDLGKAIRSEEQPGHLWDTYHVRILYTAATYKAARLKLPQAEIHTDLQTAEEEDADENPKKKRKRLPNIRFESDSDDEDMVKQTRALPPAPKIKGPNFDIQSAIKRRVQKPEPHKQMTSPEPRWSVTSLESRWSETSPESRRSAISPEPSRSTTSSEPQRQDESQRQPGTTSSSFAPLLHRLLTNQEMMMDQLKVILKSMQKMGEPARGQEPLERDILPLKDLTSLLGLEKRLREEADLKNKMITALSVIGGVDIKDSVWRVMKHCFTNSLAKQLNWRGINGKTAFHRLQLKDVITGTVRNSRLTATATDQEIEFFIKKWLHLAGDRDGGRREREKRKSVQETCLRDCHDADGPSQGGQ